jgi:dTDP-4-dehydrorhamnose reductase
VVRVPLLFGPSFDGTRGATDMLRSAHREGRELTLFEDEFRTPLHVADAADLLLDLCVDPPASGSVLHLAGPERLSRFAFAQRFAALHPDATPAFRPVRSSDPRRPPDVSLRADRPARRSLDEMLLDS